MYQKSCNEATKLKPVKNKYSHTKSKQTAVAAVTNCNEAFLSKSPYSNLKKKKLQRISLQLTLKKQQKKLQQNEVLQLSFKKQRKNCNKSFVEQHPKNFPQGNPC